MLFMWLFAMASGVANACLLEPHGVHDRGSPPSHLSNAGTTSGMAGERTEGLTHEDGDTEPTKASCLKACDDGSQSLLKDSSNFELADPVVAPFVAAAWAVEAHIAPVSGRAQT